MQIFRVNVIGQEKPYFVTFSQKQALEKMVDSAKKSGFVSVGEDKVRVSSIKSIVKVEMAREDLPDYVKVRLAEEERVRPSENRYITNLPTKWVKLDLDLKPIVDDDGKVMGGGLARPKGHEMWFLAKVYCKLGPEGEEFLLERAKIPELLKVRWDYENGCELIRERYVFGRKMDLGRLP